MFFFNSIQKVIASLVAIQKKRNILFFICILTLDEVYLINATCMEIGSLAKYCP